MAEDSFPISTEDFLRATAFLLAEEGARSEVRILASAPCEITCREIDNWNGGTYRWRAEFELPMKTYSALSEDDRTILENRISKAMNRVLVRLENHSVHAAMAMAIPKADHDWRARAQRWATGEGVTNQGRARSDNLAPLEYEGLLFRSRSEINLYSAFKALGIAIAPLPVFVKGGPQFKRIEPDFVLVHAGTMMVVEVDGDEFHQKELPAEAHERLTMLTREGVKTERVFASNCDNPEKARVCAQKLFDILKRQSTIK